MVEYILLTYGTTDIQYREKLFTPILSYFILFIFLHIYHT